MRRTLALLFAVAACGPTPITPDEPPPDEGVVRPPVTYHKNGTVETGERRYATVTDFQRDVYVVALMGSAVATALLMAPTAIHRLLYARGRKEEVVRLSHVLVLAGLGILGLSMSAAVLLVADLIFTTPVAFAMAGGLLALIAAVWVVVPLSRLRRP